MKRKTPFAILGMVVAVVIMSSFSGNDHNAYASALSTLRIGYFPNLTHAPVVIGIENGDFQKSLGNTTIDPYVFNAGPSEIEALFANQIDVAYVGPGPAINGFIKSGGDLRIISGTASGGASFVVRNDSGINSPQDFIGKKFSSPQLGNTQDIALRVYLLNNGYQTTDNGGSVTVQPASNSDIVTLMLKKSIDGAWVPEPWVTVLLHQANGKILVDERDLWPGGKFVVTNIVVRPEFLSAHPDVIKELLEANVDEINWINNNPDQARQEFNTALNKLTGKTLPDEELKEAFSRLELTYDPIASSLYQEANNTYKVGFLDSPPDLTGIYDLTLLNQVLDEKGLSEVSSNPTYQPQTTSQTQSIPPVQSSNTTTIQNAGNTNAVPEFGPIAPIILAIAVMGIVFASKTKVIQRL